MSEDCPQAVGLGLDPGTHLQGPVEPAAVRLSTCAGAATPPLAWGAARCWRHARGGHDRGGRGRRTTRLPPQVYASSTLRCNDGGHGGNPPPHQEKPRRPPPPSERLSSGRKGEVTAQSAKDGQRPAHGAWSCQVACARHASAVASGSWANLFSSAELLAAKLAGMVRIRRRHHRWRGHPPPSATLSIRNEESVTAPIAKDGDAHARAAGRRCQSPRFRSLPGAAAISLAFVNLSPLAWWLWWESAAAEDAVAGHPPPSATVSPKDEEEANGSWPTLLRHAGPRPITIVDGRRSSGSWPTSLRHASPGRVTIGDGRCSHGPSLHLARARSGLPLHPHRPHLMWAKPDPGGSPPTPLDRRMGKAEHDPSGRR
jgi:hypothetical protein